MDSRRLRGWARLSTPAVCEFTDIAAANGGDHQGPPGGQRSAIAATAVAPSVGNSSWRKASTDRGDVVEPGREASLYAVCPQRQRDIPAAPQQPDRTGTGAEDGLVSLPLLDRRSNDRMIRKKARPLSSPRRRRSARRPPRSARQGRNRSSASAFGTPPVLAPSSATPAPDTMGEGLHHPRPAKGVDGNDPVQQQNRTHPVRHRGRDLEPDRSADVMHHE